MHVCTEAPNDWYTVQQSTYTYASQYTLPSVVMLIQTLTILQVPSGDEGHFNYLDIKAST